MVRLKEGLERMWTRFDKLFQFQYGTIKRVKLSIMLLDVQMFQFQYGTIKSVSATSVVNNNASFNSNMVRLKGL